MTAPISNGVSSHYRRAIEELSRMRSIPLFDAFSVRLASLSSGDRFIFWVLATLIGLTSLFSIYSLEQSLLVRVPTYGGSLVEGTLGSPRFVNPLLAITDADRDLTALTYAGLMGLDDNGTLIPVLAESYEISPDGKQYTFVLRENARFSDGTAVTAGDVVYTVEKAQDPALKSPEYADWSGVRAEAVDARTVRFTLSKAYAPFLGVTVLGILPSHLWQGVSNEEFPFSTLETNPVGAGPFKVQSVSRNNQGLITNYTLSSNAYYALGRPYLDTIRFNFYARTEDLANAVKNESIDSSYGVPADNALTAPYSRVFGVFFNASQNQLFSKIEVRKALSFAVDRDNIVKNVLGGYASPVLGPVPPGSGIIETPVPTNAHPVEDAAAVLEKAGWTYDSATRAWKNGKLSLSQITIKTSNVPELKAVASAVKADWEKLGITTDIELYEPGDLNQNVIRPRKYEALLFGEVIGRDKDLYAFWDSQERNDPGLNIALYTNKNVDSLLESARTTSDPKERTNALQKIEDAIAADFPAAFTHAPDFIYTKPKDLGGVELPQITTPADRFAGIRNWYLNTEAVWPFFAGTRSESQ